MCISYSSYNSFPSGDPSPVTAPVGIWPSKAPAPPLARTAPSARPADALSRHHPGEKIDGTPMVSQRDMTGNDLYIYINIYTVYIL